MEEGERAVMACWRAHGTISARSVGAPPDAPPIGGINPVEPRADMLAVLNNASGQSSPLATLENTALFKAAALPALGG